jgi:hypothetical protein
VSESVAVLGLDRHVRRRVVAAVQRAPTRSARQPRFDQLFTCIHLFFANTFMLSPSVAFDNYPISD